MSCAILSRELGGIPLDVVVSEDVLSELEIPEHPVEKGAKVSDHAWRKPEVLNLEAVSADTATVSYDALKAVQTSAEPFDFLSGFTLHRNMLIQSLNPSRDVTTGRVFSFTAILKEVIIVATQEGPATDGKAGGKGGDDRGRATVNRGQVQAVSVSPSTSTPGGDTVLSRLEAI
jgi:hypothetical protein